MSKDIVPDIVRLYNKFFKLLHSVDTYVREHRDIEDEDVFILENEMYRELGKYRSLLGKRQLRWKRKNQHDH